MKLLYIHQYFNTRQGVSGTRSYEFAKYFVEKGDGVTLICGNYPNNDTSLIGDSRFFSHRTIEGIHVATVNIKYGSRMSYPRRVLSFLGFMFGACWLVMSLPKPDLIFATSTPLTIAVPGLLGQFLRRVPFVFEVRDLWPEVPIELGIIRSSVLEKATMYLARLSYKRAAKIVALSPGIVEGIVDHGIDRSKIVMIPNASDIDLFFPKPANKSLRMRLGIDANEFIAGYYGAMGFANGLQVIIDAAKILQTRGVVDIKFLLVGDGPQKSLLKERTMDLGLDSIIFSDRVPRLKIPDYVAISDVCLVIFANYKILQTNSPNKLFDAFAAGKPVITNRAGWMHQLVVNNHVGMSIPDCNPLKLADTLESMKDSPDVLHKMGVNSRRLAQEEFERHMLAERLHLTLIDAV